MVLHKPKLVTRSPLATVMLNPERGLMAMPVVDTTSLAMKLCADPELSNATNVLLPISTRSRIVCLERG